MIFSEESDASSEDDGQSGPLLFLSAGALDQDVVHISQKPLQPVVKRDVGKLHRNLFAELLQFHDLDAGLGGDSFDDLAREALSPR